MHLFDIPAASLDLWDKQTSQPPARPENDE